MDLNAPVSMLMSTNELAVASGDQSLADVWAMMQSNDVQHIPIVDDDRLVGLITSWDVARHAVKTTPAQFSELRVEDIMERSLVRLSPKASLADALEVLGEGGFHSLPVADDEQILVGILTSTDIMRYLSTGEMRD